MRFRKFTAVRDEDLGGVIEKPGEKVGWNVEKDGEDGDEGEVGDGGAEVATGEKCEAEEGKSGVEVFRGGFVPVKAGDDVEGEGDSIEAGDEEKQRDEREKEVEENEET